MRTASLAFMVLFLFCSSLAGAEPIGVCIFPENIDLTYENSIQNVTIQYVLSDGTIGPVVKSETDIRVRDTTLVSLLEHEPGSFQLTAKRSGNTTLSIECKLIDGKTAQATATITCRDAEKVRDVEFSNHIQSVLARNSCNMGACHGALAGKGGFKLSLRGYDPAADHFNITRQDGGRRIEVASPATSLFIAKPSGAIEHKGGMRLPVDSVDYAMFANWIATGAAGPRANDPHLVELEILPCAVRL
ncbi:MAG TPA: hypothetical protein VM260_11855, partial [Pirellula sp.]|nr:hypothetical protein [Pirellula sp.]